MYLHYKEPLEKAALFFMRMSYKLLTRIDSCSKLARRKNKFLKDSLICALLTYISYPSLSLRGYTFLHIIQTKQTI